MTMSLRQAAGNLLVVGLGGTDITSLERAWLRLVRPGGVILFRRNIAGAAQTRALLDEATALCASNAFRCVDIEGGTVDRLRDALAPLPSAKAVALADRQRVNHRTGFAFEHGELVALGARAFGFNTSLAPVLDLALPDGAEVMGTRVVAEDAAGVAAYAKPFLAGLAAHGVAGCGKHFPGLGAGMRDSHVETPFIERSWAQLWTDDLVPYRALRSQLPMVMVNHAAYPATRSKDVPASASPFWITGVLRTRLGYRGLIFSDDMEMGGILKFLSVEDAVVAAIRAGMDVVEFCHSPELIMRACEALIAEGERSPSFAKLLVARAGEVERKRTKLFRQGAGRPLTARQFAALQARIQRFRERVDGAVNGLHSGLRHRPQTPVEAA